MTKARAATLAALRHAAEPLSAAALYRLLAADCDQATVYRTLHYLEEKGYAESFVLHCSEHGTERYYSARGDACGDACGAEADHRHWFHCEACHRFIELGACTISDLVRRFEEDQQVSVRRHTLYFTGLCADCRGADGRTES